jgi:hypothetical protein
VICTPRVHSNISTTVKLGDINSQFYSYWRFRSCEKFFVSHMGSLIVLLKNKDYPLKIWLRGLEVLFIKEKFVL